MAENIRMDSHKLIYHPQRVADFLRGETIYPIEVEIGLSGACNHRCVFCAVDYMGYDSVMLDANILLKNLEIMSRKGLKSVIYAGEGEPLLNKNAGTIINRGKDLGIDNALSTNGVLLTEEFSKDTLASLTWVRFSIAAGTEKTYKKIHNAKDGDLEKVFTNMQKAVEVKQNENLKTTLGAQLLLLPENKNEVVLMAKKFKEIGIDYFTIKPFSQHPSGKAKLQVDYNEMSDIEAELKGFESDNYKVYVRRTAMDNLKYKKHYKKCRGLNFMTYIDAKGDVYPCIAFMGQEELKYGRLYEQTFDKIWESKMAEQIRNSVQGEMIHCKCREACRLDEINKYLEELVEPGEHVNFI